MTPICPCGSEKLYENCCGYFHSGKGSSLSAESLMRSRYTAFVFKNEQYLLQTWHESKRPKVIDFNTKSVNWLGLKILYVEAGSEKDINGRVEFIANFKAGSNYGKLHEISSFIKENSKWFYVDGKIIND